jgi:hypothetical protein
MYHTGYRRWTVHAPFGVVLGAWKSDGTYSELSWLACGTSHVPSRFQDAIYHFHAPFGVVLGSCTLRGEDGVDVMLHWVSLSRRSRSLHSPLSYTRKIQLQAVS